MNLNEIVILVLLAIVSTVIAVMFIPRVRRVLWFEILLWLATGVVAVLCAWLGVVAVSQIAILNSLTGIAVQDTPIIPAALGALGGALLLNVPLWFMDRSGGQVAEEEIPTEE